MEFEIPVDKEIMSFANHLNANPRTILSSKFGDGKSYFLQKIKDDPQIVKDFKFLTIYPVNYQVASNKDIFELIKRDVLCQLLLHNMFDNKVVLTEAEAFSWFIYLKGSNYLGDFLSYFTELGMDSSMSTKVLIATKGLKLFKQLKFQYKKFKKEEVNYEETRIEDFINKIDSSYLLESDTITRIIVKVIENYRRYKKKKVVLLIEDMDRLDPAHLFRILNVLSAHMDYCYKCFVKPDKSLVGNKFGVDNIVIALDYTNLHHIYQHFYGVHTDFNGYITKFLSSTPFHYSLKNVRHKYILEAVEKLTHLPQAIINKLIEEETYDSNTIRELVQSFDIKTQITQTPIAIYDGKRYAIDTSLLKLIAIYKRLKKTKDEIIDLILRIKKIDEDIFFKYLCPFMFEEQILKHTNKYPRLCVQHKDFGKVIQEFELCKETGLAIMGNYCNAGRDQQVTDFNLYIERMTNFVV